MARMLILKKILSRRFTFMLVPEGAGKPRQISIPFSILLVLFGTWTGVTFWGSYLSAQHIDYWRTQLSNQVLEMKVNYLIAQIDKSRIFIDEVRQVEANMRQLLELNNETVSNKNAPDGLGTGGPTVSDQNDLSRFLNRESRDISWKRLYEKIQDLEGESQNRLSAYTEFSEFIEKERKLFRASPLGWPCPGRRTSHFGKRLDPFHGSEEFHFGIDIAGPAGTPIRATADGKVILSSWHMGYGNLVIIQHDFGYTTRYGHNSRLKVKVGDKVRRGEIIATMGETGRASGPHCHYEVWRYGKRQNPYTYMIGKSTKVNPISKLPEEKIKPLISN